MKMTCPHCGVAGSAPGSQAGEKVRCPQCEKVFLVTERKIACPHCAVVGVVGDSAEGAKLRCPQCEKVFLLTRELLAGWRPAGIVAEMPAMTLAAGEMATALATPVESAGASSLVGDADSTLEVIAAQEPEDLVEPDAGTEPESAPVEEVVEDRAEESDVVPALAQNEEFSVGAEVDTPMAELGLEPEEESEAVASVESEIVPDTAEPAGPFEEEIGGPELKEEVAESATPDDTDLVTETKDKPPVHEPDVEFIQEADTRQSLDSVELPQAEMGVEVPAQEILSDEAPELSHSAGKGDALAQLASEAAAGIEPATEETPVAAEIAQAALETSDAQAPDASMDEPLPEGEKPEETITQDTTEPAATTVVCAGCGETFEPELMREISSQPFCAVCQLRLAAAEEKETAPVRSGRIRGVLAAIILLGLFAGILLVLVKLGVL